MLRGRMADRYAHVWKEEGKKNGSKKEKKKSTRVKMDGVANESSKKTYSEIQRLFLATVSENPYSRPYV